MGIQLSPIEFLVCCLQLADKQGREVTMKELVKSLYCLLTLCDVDELVCTCMYICVHLCDSVAKKIEHIVTHHDTMNQM